MANESILKLTKSKAIELHNTISVMTGSNQHKLLRHQVQQAITKAWPEILTGKPAPDAPATDPNETRNVPVTARELRALGEGILSLLSRKDKAGQPDVIGQEFAILIQLAETCRISKWVTSQIKVDDVPEDDIADPAVDIDVKAPVPTAQ